MWRVGLRLEWLKENWTKGGGGQMSPLNDDLNPPVSADNIPDAHEFARQSILGEDLSFATQTVYNLVVGKMEMFQFQVCVMKWKSH